VFINDLVQLMIVPFIAQPTPNRCTGRRRRGSFYIAKPDEGRNGREPEK
jgi:hypothetical protein